MVWKEKQKQTEEREGWSDEKERLGRDRTDKKQMKTKEDKIFYFFCAL